MLYTFATREWRPLRATRVDNLIWTRDSRYLYADPDGPVRWARRIRIADGHVEPIFDLKECTIAHADAGLALDGRPLFLIVAQDIYALELARR